MTLVVSSGVTDYIVSGSIGRNVLVSGGNVTVENGGKLINSTVHGGGIEVESGGISSRSHIFQGTLDIQGGRSIDATLEAGTSLNQQGGTSIDMTIRGVHGLIFNHAVASGTHITADSELDADTQVSLFGTLITGGGQLVVAYGKSHGTFVADGGSENLNLLAASSGTRVGSGGFEIVGDGSKSNGTIVGAHGTEIVGNLGSSIGTVIRSGGAETIDSGGVAQDISVRSGGAMILAGGTFTGHIASGGQLTVEAAISFGGVVQPATYKYLRVTTGVELTVDAGATTNHAAIHSGGTLSVSSKGTAQNTLLAGGREIVMEGGSLAGVQSFQANGTLVIEGANPSEFTASGFGGTNAFDLSSFAANSAEKLSVTNNAGKTKTTVSISEGAEQVTIVLFGQYVAAGFHMNSDGAAGTTITYVAPTAAQHELANPHR